MKSIVFISILAAGLIKISEAPISVSEPVVLILLGVCLIGFAKIGRKRIKNENSSSVESNHHVAIRNYPVQQAATGPELS